MTKIIKELSTEDKECLAIAERWASMPGFSWRSLAHQRGWSPVPVAHFQHLNRLLDSPAALAYAPVLVARLRRLRTSYRRRTS